MKAINLEGMFAKPFAEYIKSSLETDKVEAIFYSQTEEELITYIIEPKKLIIFSFTQQEKIAVSEKYYRLDNIKHIEKNVANIYYPNKDWKINLIFSNNKITITQKDIRNDNNSLKIFYNSLLEKLY